MRKEILPTTLMVMSAMMMSAATVPAVSGDAGASGVVAQPADGSTVAGMSAIVLEFPEAAVAAWNYGALNTATAPRLEFEGTRVGTYTSLGEEGNRLTMDFAYGGYDDAGEYTVYVQPGTYMLDGEPGEMITLHYSILSTGIGSVEVSVDTVTVTDCNGRTVLENAAPEALEGLKGIYIVNGIKRVLR